MATNDEACLDEADNTDSTKRSLTDTRESSSLLMAINEDTGSTKSYSSDARKSLHSLNLDAATNESTIDTDKDGTDGTTGSLGDAEDFETLCVSSSPSTEKLAESDDAPDATASQINFILSKCYSDSDFGSIKLATPTSISWLTLLQQPLQAVNDRPSISGHARDTPERSYEMTRLSNASQRRHQLLQLLHFTCPISGCSEAINPSGLLSHCLSTHGSINHHHLELGKPLELWLWPNELVQAQSSCLAVLLLNNLAQTDTNAIESQDEHCTLLMLCRTSWDVLNMRYELAGPQTGEFLADKADVTNLYILWLLCPQVQHPFTFMLNVSDHQWIHMKSAELQTCDTTELLGGYELLGPDPDPCFLRLTHAELKQLTENFTQPMQLQLQLEGQCKQDEQLKTMLNEKFEEVQSEFQ